MALIGPTDTSLAAAIVKRRHLFKVLSFPLGGAGLISLIQQLYAVQTILLHVVLHQPVDNMHPAGTAAGCHDIGVGGGNIADFAIVYFAGNFIVRQTE